ncbi:hypothetical protein [Thiohalomonas denitrificans]|uniref:hypothetical protein n=1 Tax=Thiohalomonas denitrificans TaxID=415747 RepID=UPI0026ED0502|nr:hypothetical protein [Thiohalomonas denitrificans]
MLTKLLGLLALIGSGLAVLFRGQSKHHQAQARREHQRADRAEASADVHRRVDAARAETQTRQRDEAVAIDDQLKAGRRDHLEGDW